MNTTKKIGLGLLAVLAVVVIVLGVNYFSSVAAQNLSGAGTGENHYKTENFLQGLFAGTLGQLKVTNSGALQLLNTSGAPGAGIYIGSSTQNYDITQVVFATSTFATTTFGSVTSATGTVFQQMTFPYPNLGRDDVCLGSLTSAPTSTAFEVAASISFASTTTATSSVLLENGTSTAVTVGAGVLTVLCIDPAF